MQEKVGTDNVANEFIAADMICFRPSIQPSSKQLAEYLNLLVNRTQLCRHRDT
jgi:hypothetical protein